MAHRRVEHRREAEPDAGLARRDAATRVGRQVDRDPERLQHVRRAAGRRRGPVAVLDHGHAGRRDDDGGHRRDVDGARLVAPGADDVHRGPGHRHPARVPQHRRRRARRPRPRPRPWPAARRGTRPVGRRSPRPTAPGPSPRRCRRPRGRCPRAAGRAGPARSGRPAVRRRVGHGVSPARAQAPSESRRRRPRPARAAARPRRSRRRSTGPAGAPAPRRPATTWRASGRRADAR